MRISVLGSSPRGVPMASALRRLPSARTATGPRACSRARPPARPRLTLSPCQVKEPLRPSGSSEGTYPRTTLTTPARALEPWSRVRGPRTTSMRSVVIGSMATAWSEEVAERSPVRSPSSSTSRRSPPSPRSTGRAGAGPMERWAMPGS